MNRGLVKIFIAAPWGTRTKLGEHLRDAAEAAAQISGEDRWNTEELDPEPAALVRARLRDHIRALRESGALLDTVDAVVAHGVRTEYAQRWGEEVFDPAPAHASLQGRWPGTRDGGWEERITAQLPADLEERVRAACWHDSADAIAEIRRWRRFNPGVAVRGLQAPGMQSLLLEYNTIADRVTPTGDIWRAALHHVLG